MFKIDIKHGPNQLATVVDGFKRTCSVRLLLQCSLASAVFACFCSVRFLLQCSLAPAVFACFCSVRLLLQCSLASAVFACSCSAFFYTIRSGAGGLVFKRQLALKYTQCSVCASEKFCMH